MAASRRTRRAEIGQNQPSESCKNVLPLALPARFQTRRKDSFPPVLNSSFVSNGVGVTGALDMSKAERTQVHARDHQVV